MYTVIGTQNCGKCNYTKKILEQKAIPYIYKLFTDLSEEQQFKYLDIAKQNEVQSFPLIFDELDNLIKEI